MLKHSYLFTKDTYRIFSRSWAARHPWLIFGTHARIKVKQIFLRAFRIRAEREIFVLGNYDFEYNGARQCLGLAISFDALNAIARA